MSTPPSFRSIPIIDGSFVLDDRPNSEMIRSDQYPEVNREHEILEIVKDYPEVIPEKHGSRTCDYRISGVRSWILVVWMCVIVIAVAVAVGLAIGIPASNRKSDNADSTTRLPSTTALAASDVTSSRSSVELGSATISSTPSSSISPGSTPKATSLSSSGPSSRTVTCPANDTDIFTTFSNDLAIPDQIDSHNLKYRVHCKRDYPVRGDVTDMFALTVGSLVECIKRCSMFNLQLPVANKSFSWLCSGVALVEDTCTLKKTVTENATSVPRQDMVGSAVLVWDDPDN